MLIGGDLSSLSPEQRVEYMKAVCKSIGVNPLTGPFGYILFKETEAAPAKLVLYAKKDCAEQLRKIHRVSVLPGTTKRMMDEDYATVEMSLRDATGRTDTSTGMVYLWKTYQNKTYRLTGQRLADAVMKAETKAKRRGTLSICGLGILDEMDLESVRVVGGVTHDGRIFRYENEIGPLREPALLDESAAHGHEQGSDKAKQAEEQLRKVEAADKAALEARRATKSTTIDQPPSHAESPQKPSVDAREMAILTAEKTPQGDFVITGDVQASPELYAAVEKHFVWIKDFWHATEEDLRAMAQLQTQLKFTLKMPQTSGAKERREQPDGKTTNPAGGSAAGTTAEPEVVSGAIERTTSGMTHKNAPTRQVKIGKAWYSCFVNTIFEFLDKGVGKEAEVFVDKRKNIVGLKRVGKTQFDADGRTPVIQRKDQEAGGSLFGK